MFEWIVNRVHIYVPVALLLAIGGGMRMVDGNEASGYVLFAVSGLYLLMLLKNYLSNISRRGNE